MAISRSVRPTVIVAGGVERTRELRRKADNEVYGHEVVLAQESGAQVAVTIYSRNGSPVAPIPGVGEFFAAEASVEESRDFGASLIYEGSAASILDQIHSALSVGAKA
jgi:hypothetical protein